MPARQVPPVQIQTPNFKSFINLAGGLNVSQPPDQILDTQSPDLQNLIYINGVLQVDTGYVTYGNRLIGEPLQPIQFELTTGTLVTCLVTTTAFYTWDNELSDWTLAMSSILTTTTSTAVNFSPWAISFSCSFGPVITTPPTITMVSTTGISVGDLVQIAVAEGGYYNSTITSVVGNEVTFADPLLPCQSVEIGAAVSFFGPLQGGGYPISWTVDPTTNTLIWTNGVDYVQAFEGSGATAPLEGLKEIASTARLVSRFYGFTLAIGTIEGGTEYPYRVRRSTNVSSTDWSSEIAGFDDLVDTPDAITSVSVIASYIVLGRETTVMTGTYWGTAEQIFFWQYTLTGIGVLGGTAIAKTNQNDVLISQSGVYNYSAGFTLQGFGDAVFNYFLGPQGNLSPTNAGNLFSIYVEQLDEVWVFYPASGAVYCNTILRYSNKYGGWFPQAIETEIAGACFAYQSTSHQWDQAIGNWLQQVGAWTSRSSTSNFPFLLLASASDRLVYKYDFISQQRNGIDIPWYFVTKDFPVLQEKLLFDGINAYGKGNNILVEISINQGQTWQTVGVFNFGTTNYSKQTLDYQISGDFFRLRFSGTKYGFFLSQFTLRYLTESEY